METTRISTKGQIVLPKGIRESHAWVPGTELIVEDAGDGVFLHPSARVAATTLDEVVGCLSYKGKPKTVSQMKRAIGREVTSRRDRGRY
jgi:AbrB family looped-hinge helix DNA binding protein